MDDIIRIAFTHGGGNFEIARLRREVRNVLQRQGQYARFNTRQAGAAVRRLEGQIANMAPRSQEARAPRGGRGRGARRTGRRERRTINYGPIMP